ncbi:MAG: hypothetical protein LBK42_12115 [Propionibacteriaceae bacterium]|jgi:DNA-binding transcriptional regulator LsrR (DeoR family)|nr:hypothetical protein [Propionibacteriaceae bacterium]
MYTSPPASAVDRAHVGLLLEVARRYWEAGQSQAEIAAAVGFSRPSVSRLLAEARRRGVVSITIGHPLERLARTEARLKQRYGLKQVRVADATTSPDEVFRCAAALLAEACADDSLIVVSNGRAVAGTVAAMPQLRRPRAKVVQMIGALGRDNPLTDSPEVCRSLAERLDGSFHALAVPLVLSSPEIAAQMRREDQIAATLALGGRADIALVGVGAVQVGHSGHIFDSYETPADARALARAGAVAHICGHHVTGAGEHMRTPICARTLSIEPERLRRVPLSIGVAHGLDKVEAIKAVIAGRFISALVTDRFTAESLLGGAPPPR